MLLLSFNSSVYKVCLAGALGGRPAQITDKANSKVGFSHFQAIIAKKLEVGEGLS